MFERLWIVLSIIFIFLILLFVYWIKYWKILIFIILLLIFSEFFLKNSENSFLKIGQKYLFETNITEANQKYFLINFENERIISYQHDFSQFNKVEIGSKIVIEGTIFKFQNSNSFWAINKNVKYILSDTTIHHIQKPNISISNLINIFSKEQGEIFDNYWKIFVFGEKETNGELIKNTHYLSIIHLIIISGLHIDIIFWMLKKVFSIFKIKIDSFYFAFIIVSFYIFFTYSFISPIRVLLVKLYEKINKKARNFDGLIFSLIFLFILQTKIFLNLGFLLSFGNYFIIKLNKKPNNFLQKIKLFFILNIFNSFFIIYSIGKYNLFSVFWILIFMPVFEFVYLSSILLFWLPYVLNFIYFILQSLISISLKISIFIPFGFFNFQFLYLWMFFWFFVFILIKIKNTNNRVWSNKWFGAPKKSRTPNLLVRSQTLCPIELWAHMEALTGFEPVNQSFADLCLGRLAIVPYVLYYIT